MEIYLVGGAVRDEQLGLPVADRDWVVVGATPEQMQAQGFIQVGKDFPVFLHPRSKEEYALARTERKSGTGYTGFKCDASPRVTLEEDLLRRDLTINAIAQDQAKNLIDPFQGLDDLKQRILRHVSPAFAEDPLRILRLARFAARFAEQGFTVAPATIQLVRAMVGANELTCLSAERVWLETEKAMKTPHPAAFFNLLAICDALQPWYAELARHWHAPMAAQLDQAAQQSEDKSERVKMCMSLLVLPFDTEQHVRQFCQRLKCPNDVRDLALLSHQHGLALTQCNDPATMLGLLNQTDVWRKAQRFQLLLRVSQQLVPVTQRQRFVDKINTAVDAAKKVDAKALVAAGYQGQKIKQRLEQQRQDAIARAWQSCSQQ